MGWMENAGSGVLATLALIISLRTGATLSIIRPFSGMARRYDSPFNYWLTILLLSGTVASCLAWAIYPHHFQIRTSN